MARKIFLSVLGTGFYKNCQYETTDFISTPTPFIQEATLEYLMKEGEWTSNDRVLIFLTQTSRKENWDKEITQRYNRVKEQYDDYKALEMRLMDMNLPMPYRGVDIVDGSSEAEIWEIFDTIFNEIEQGDELFIDITHGFRYLPMLVLVLGNYAKFLKNATVKHISYGNYESPNTIKPLMNLLPLSGLQDWTFAAANYIENGEVERLLKLSNDELKYLLRDKDATKSEPARQLRRILNNLAQITDDFRGCRGLNVWEARSIKNLKEQSTQLDEVSFIKPLKPILNAIIDPLNSALNSESGGYVNGYVAAQWCYDHKLYQQAITILRENIVTHLGVLMGIELTKTTTKELPKEIATYVRKREALSGLINCYAQKMDVETQYRRNSEEDELVYSLFIENRDLIDKFADVYKKISGCRNDYNHFGFNAGAQKLKDIKSAIKDALETINGIVDNDHRTVEAVDKLPLLINLSNHPYDTWDDEQKDAAVHYGEIEDIVFPAISPDAGGYEIRMLAEDYAQIIKDKARKYKVTVHVMGELTFTFALVGMLHQEGIACIASCAKRNVTNDSDGSKRVTFNFERFREYVCE